MKPRIHWWADKQVWVLRYKDIAEGITVVHARTWDRIQLVLTAVYELGWVVR